MSLYIQVLWSLGPPWPPPRDSGLPKSRFVVHPFFLQKSTLIFDRFLKPKLHQNGPKMGAKIHPKSIQNLIDFFIDFWMRFWSQNGSRNGPQDHQKSWKNQSRTVSGLKNVIFSKIAPRLHENTIFEGSGSPKRSQNWPKTVQEPLQNPTEMLIEFWIDFLLILAPFWLPKLVQNGSKNDPKNVSKNRLKNHWKMFPKWLLKWRYGYGRGPPFWALFLVYLWIGFFKVPRAPQGPKMNDFGSQNGPPKLPKWWPRPPSRHRKCNTSDRCLKAEFKFCRVIPKKIYVKKVLRRCSAQRAQSAAALLGV